MHWVGVLEREIMKPVLVPQVATHPLNAKVVCHLCKDIQIPVNLSCSLLLSVSWQTIFREIFLFLFLRTIVRACMHDAHTEIIPTEIYF